VGIAADVEGREARETRTALMLYRPWTIRPATAAAAPAAPRPRNYDWRLLVVRANDVEAALPLIKSAIWSVDASQPIEKIALVEDLYAEAFARQRFVLQLMMAFAAIAVILTAAGVFGVLSQIVAQRTREIGVRMALGADRRNVQRLVVGEAVRTSAVGLVLGLAISALASRLLGSLLFGVRPFDPAVLICVALFLLVSSLLASSIPAARASRLDPSAALRSE
jgi:ABC-type antimicrobial peptide transport system permease subunit